MKKGKIVIVSGPSGSGKTTLCERLLSSPKVKGRLIKSVSVTTRPRRPGERHGRDYFFVSAKMFLYKKRAGHFLETEQVFEHFYGTPQNQVRGLLHMGKSVLLNIDVRGAQTVSRKFPGAVKIFIKTPSEKILVERLWGRGTEEASTLRLRLREAKKEMREARNYDYVVVNDVLSKALAALEGIVLGELT